MFNRHKKASLVAVSLLAATLPIQSACAGNITLADSAEFVGSLAGIVSNCLNDESVFKKLETFLEQAPSEVRPLMTSHVKAGLAKGMAEHVLFDMSSSSWEKYNCENASKLKGVFDDAMANVGVH